MYPGSAGCGSLIDDFGTGYSSLAYLRRYPVDCIKLAREFVTNLATDANDVAITQVALGLARLLQIDVIAEGVETAVASRVYRNPGAAGQPKATISASRCPWRK